MVENDRRAAGDQRTGDDHGRDAAARPRPVPRSCGLQGDRRWTRARSAVERPIRSALLLDRKGERRVLAQNARLELAQSAAGLDPELLDQHPPGLLVALERVGLAVTAVEGQHELGS